MSIISTAEAGITTVTIDFPPVNGIPVKGWFDLADAVLAAGRDPSVHVVVLRAENRGFCAGVDIKEADRDPGAMVAVNRGCHAAFGAVYDCPVPVIAAVHGFCLGGGIGIVGNADVIVASNDAEFGLPEVARGALGAATHLSRLVPPRMETVSFSLELPCASNFALLPVPSGAGKSPLMFPRRCGLR